MLGPFGPCPVRVNRRRRSAHVPLIFESVGVPGRPFRLAFPGSLRNTGLKDDLCGTCSGTLGKRGPCDRQLGAFFFSAKIRNGKTLAHAETFIVNQLCLEDYGGGKAPSTVKFHADTLREFRMMLESLKSSYAAWRSTPALRTSSGEPLMSLFGQIGSSRI
jgi:hypothetical protein